MKRAHYRGVQHTPRPEVLYPRHWRKWQAELGKLRTAPFLLAVDTGRWFQRCPEQLAVAFKSIGSDLFAELAHQIRRPSHHIPISSSGLRKPDHYQQHTKSWFYNLGTPSHARGFQNLLKYCTAFAAGAENQGVFHEIYKMEVGARRELARWPIQGLYRPEGKKCVPCEDEGYEVLEAVCIPGETPREPKILSSSTHPIGANHALSQYGGGKPKAQHSQDPQRDVAVVIAERQVRKLVETAKKTAIDLDYLKEHRKHLARARKKLREALDTYDLAYFAPGDETKKRIALTQAFVRGCAKPIWENAPRYDRATCTRLKKAVRCMLEAAATPKHDMATAHLEEAGKILDKARKKLHDRRKRYQQKAEVEGRKLQQLKVHRKRLFREQEHWHKQVRGCASKKIELRLRRVWCPVKGGEEPAFWLKNAHELDIPLPAARRLAKQLPAFWGRVHAHYEREAGRSWPREQNEPKSPFAERTYNQLRFFYRWDELRAYRARETTPPNLRRLLSYHRQYAWDEKIVNRYFMPWMVDWACRYKPEHGLFLREWPDELDRYSDEYKDRLALWQARLLSWDPNWTVDELTACSDVLTAPDGILDSIAQTFLLLCATIYKGRRTQRAWVTNTHIIPKNHSAASRCEPIRGPPPA